MTSEPVLNYDSAVADVAEAGGWHDANRYTLWVGREEIDAPVYELLERRDGVMLRLPLQARLMHLIPAGTPHRMTHLFAPWRVSDADTIYLRYAVPEGIYHTLLTAMSRMVKEDQILWLCPGCGAEMERAAFDTRVSGMASFWPFLLQEVRAFNRDAVRRSCSQCGRAHPQCYGFDARNDVADEAAARQAW
jgi:hypothetical protein